MKITPETTLSELEVLRLQLGVTSMLTTLKTHTDGSMLVEVLVIARDGTVTSSGPDLVVAIAKAFEQREKQIGNLMRRSYP